MFKLKTSILSVLALGTIVSTAGLTFAQTAGPDTPGAAGGNAPTTEPAHKGGGMLARLTAALDLTPDEVTQIKPILKDEQTTIKGIRADTTLTDDQKKDQSKAARDKANTAINAILTPDQQTKFAKLQEERREKQEDKGGNAAPATAPATAPAAPAAN